MLCVIAICPAAGLPPAALPPATRRLARVAVASVVVSVGLMLAAGLSGPSVTVPEFAPAFPWPPYFTSMHLSDLVVTGLAWLATVIGGLGLAAALLAVRRGWRPGPRRLLIGCLLAVAALTLMPPLGSTDMLDYAIYGRMAALGHSAYVMTPRQFTATGDPVGRFSPPAWRDAHSVYGPLGTLSEQAASLLAGPSTAKTIFWLKVQNALAFLAVALALDWLLRSDPAGRARAHLLWSVNPLMLWAVMGGGHIDGLAAGAGVLGLLLARRLSPVRGLVAGLLIGVAMTIKAPFALFLLGPAWAARRSPRTLAAVAVGAAAVAATSYLLASRGAVTAVLSRAVGKPDLYQPWQLLVKVLGLHHAIGFTNVAGLCAAAVLAPVLLWRLPPGPADPLELPGRPGAGGLRGLSFVRPVLAVSLAWLICSPQQRPWFDAMIFPLLALMPATRLDWIVAARGLIAALGELPGVGYHSALRPPALAAAVDVILHDVVPDGLVVVIGALVWLCVTGRWGPGRRAGQAGAERPLPDMATSGVPG
jgi:alpha-1,6-mannosyltransferase